MQTQLRDVEIDRRLRGRSDMEQELKQCEADTPSSSQGIGLEDLAAAEAMLAAEQEHVARIDRLDCPAGRARRQGAARDAA